MSGGRASPLRSLLFVPAGDIRRVRKALTSVADAVILDLEDAVAMSRKAEARQRAAEIVASSSRAGLYVRVNPASTAACLADLDAVIRGHLVAIMLAKAVSAEQVAAVAWAMEQFEQQRGLRPNSIDLVPLIETAAGIVALEGVCRAAPRVRRLAFGAADYTADLGIEWTTDETELDAPRRALVTISRACQLEPPLDAPVLEFRDIGRMRAAASRSRAFGFQGKLCIHPAQLAACHEAFAPLEAELEWARRVIAAFETAERGGIAAIDVDGALVDHAIVVRARRLLASAD